MNTSTTLESSSSVEYNVDKRTKRKMDGKEFISAIQELKIQLNENGLNLFPFSSTSTGKENERESERENDSNVSVYIRKRPLFPYEEERGEYDVITPLQGGEQEGVVISQCRQRMIPKRGVVRQLGNVFYPCQKVFDEASDNYSIYLECAKPLLDRVWGGESATCFLFGQTGSGKTFTMTAIQQHLSDDLFQSQQTELTNPTRIVHWDLICYELIGKRVYDLLDPSHGELHLLTDGEGKTCVTGATRLSLDNLTGEEINQIFQDASCRRETVSTRSNASSSRSHAVCQISRSLFCSLFPHSLNRVVTDLTVAESPSAAVLTLVDLAGSERKEDSLYHDRATQQQTAEINTSLMTLKECLRIKSVKRRIQRESDQESLNSSFPHLHIPYRNSNLTRILKDSFESSSRSGESGASGGGREVAVNVIIALTPTVTNTEHTLTTLQLITTVMNENPSQSQTGSQREYVMEVKEISHSISSSSIASGSSSSSSHATQHPSKWSNAILCDWVMCWLAQKKKSARDSDSGSPTEKVKSRLGKSVTGKEIMRWTPQRFGDLFTEENDREIWGREIYQALRDHLTRLQSQEKAQRQVFLNEKKKKESIPSTYSQYSAPSNPLRSQQS